MSFPIQILILESKDIDAMQCFTSFPFVSAHIRKWQFSFTTDEIKRTVCWIAKL